MIYDGTMCVIYLDVVEMFLIHLKVLGILEIANFRLDGLSLEDILLAAERNENNDDSIEIGEE